MGALTGAAEWQQTEPGQPFMFVSSAPSGRALPLLRAGGRS